MVHRLCRINEEMMMSVDDGAEEYDPAPLIDIYGNEANA